MTLRKKAIWITIAALSVIMGVLIVVSHFIILSHFDTLEQRVVKRNVMRINSALQGEMAQLQTAVSDWAFWDDTYQFMLTRDPQYIKSNMSDSSFVNLHVNDIALFDAKGALVYGRSYDAIKKRQHNLPTELVRNIRFSKDVQGISGFVRLRNGELAVFSACPILDSNMKGPPRGTLLMGRLMDAAETARISKTTHLSFTLYHYAGRQTPDDILWARIFTLKQNIAVRPMDNKLIAGYSNVNDFQGKPVGIIKTVTAREIHIQGEKAMRWYAFYLLMVGIIFSILIFQLLERMVISRLSRLNESIKAIDNRQNLSYRLELNGNDELTNVARTMNEMLANLEKSRHELEISEAKLRAMFKNTPNPIFIIDWQTKETYGTNQAGLEFLECSLDELGEKKCWQKLSGALNSDHEEEVLLTDSQTMEVDCEVHGKRKTLLINLVPVHTEEKVFIYVIGQDITERKQMEEQLTYLSMNDSLTGMHNRIYFERVLQDYEQPEYRPVGLLRCDIDGLKLVNDSFGNKAGDALIVAVSGILHKAVDNLGLIARTGGDDFTVLIPNASIHQLEAVHQAIRTAIAEFNSNQAEIPLSLSVGLELNNDLPLAEALKNAENNMVREKLHRQLSAKSALVQALMKAMEARDFITEGHAARMEEFIVRLGRRIGLSEPRLADLRLLAQFHDIGKVGIPDRILLKPGALNEEEQQEMRRHCEIGYRIALSTPDLTPIAKSILKHHEWWNGNGYPLGLSGEDIPLECRLLSIVDAFDAMTNDRPYRKALPMETAVEEIRKCSGIQFDPDLAERFIAMISEKNSEQD